MNFGAFNSYQEFAMTALKDPRFGLTQNYNQGGAKAPSGRRQVRDQGSLTVKLFSAVSEGLLGVVPEADKKHTNLPKGWKVQHTKDGRPYLAL